MYNRYVTLPDGTSHTSIAAAVSRLLATQGRSAYRRPTPAPIVAPAAVRVAASTVQPQTVVQPDPFAVLMGLKRQLRHAQAELDAVPTIPGCPVWSAAHRYNLALRARYAAPVARLTRAVADHRKRFGIPVVQPWKPRPAHAADRRMCRQYRAEATPTGWPQAPFLYLGNVAA